MDDKVRADWLRIYVNAPFFKSKLPKHLVQSEKLVPGLDGRKMSKSYGNHIPLFMESKKLRKLIMKIVTDSQPPEAPKDTKNSILFDLYKEFASPEQVSDLAKHYDRGIGWGDVKQKLFEVVEEYFKGPAELYNDLMSQPEKLEKILNEGASKARQKALPLMQKVRSAVRG